MQGMRSQKLIMRKKDRPRKVKNGEIGKAKNCPKKIVTDKLLFASFYFVLFLDDNICHLLI